MFQSSRPRNFGISHEIYTHIIFLDSLEVAELNYLNFIPTNSIILIIQKKKLISIIINNNTRVLFFM